MATTAASAASEALDPQLLGKEAPATVRSLTGEQLALLLGVKKLSQLKYPVNLIFEHKRFALYHLDFLNDVGDVVKT